MSFRSVLKNGICIAAVLALLVSVIAFPMGPLRTASGSPLLNCLFHRVLNPSTQSAHVSLKSIPSGLVRLRALPSEKKEATSETTHPVSFTFDFPPTPSSKRVWHSTYGSFCRTIHPLRC